MNTIHDAGSYSIEVTDGQVRVCLYKVGPYTGAAWFKNPVATGYRDRRRAWTRSVTVGDYDDWQIRDIFDDPMVIDALCRAGISPIDLPWYTEMEQNSIEPVYDGGFLLWHTINRGHHLAPVREYRVDGDEFVTVSEAGELRLPKSGFHEAGHGPCLAYGPEA